MKTHEQIHRDLSAARKFYTETDPNEQLVAGLEIAWDEIKDDTDPVLGQLWEEPKSGEVVCIAMVQKFGWIEDESDSHKSVVSRGFASQEQAVRWVETLVQRMHGEIAQTRYHHIEDSRTTDDQTRTFEMEVIVVRSSGGPTFGVIVGC